MSTLRSEVETIILRALAARETVVPLTDLKEALRLPDRACPGPHVYDPHYKEGRALAEGLPA